MMDIQASGGGTSNSNDTSTSDCISHDYTDLISSFVDSLSSHLRLISLEIHDNPELRYKEIHAHELLTSFLRQQDAQRWEVTPSAYGIGTAFVAVFEGREEGAVVSFNAEYDALAGIGHACGHNLIAVASLAAALATAEVVRVKGLGGKVVLFGTPAEEGGGGKIRLLEAGAYRDHHVDVSLMSHPSVTPDAALVRTAAYAGMKVEYFGKEAHAAARPWEGINALDALVTAYNAISVLRQQTQPGDIIQCQIINGGLRPNIVHAYSSGQFVVRSATKARLDALHARVIHCLEGAATATGARLNITPSKYAYQDHVPNHALGRVYRRAFNDLGGHIPRGGVEEFTAVTQASTDQGNVSHALPSLHTNFWIRSEDAEGGQLGGPHTPDFERAARTEESHDRAMRVGKALAATAVEVLTCPTLLAEIKREFDEIK
ncbi:hypothetical protein Q7P37_003889 [Cladosporium fusiforme]